jgi:hypothetical protein
MGVELGFTLRGEHRLGVFENRVLRKIFGLKMDEVIGGWRKLHNEPEGKRPIGRPRRRWENNIKMDFREIGWGGMDWIDLARPVEGSCEHDNEPSGSIKCWEILE